MLTFLHLNQHSLLKSFVATATLPVIDYRSPITEETCDYRYPITTWTRNQAVTSFYYDTLHSNTNTGRLVLRGNNHAGNNNSINYLGSALGNDTQVDSSVRVLTTAPML